jgi:hypothetical protein
MSRPTDTPPGPPPQDTDDGAPFGSPPTSRQLTGAEAKAEIALLRRHRRFFIDCIAVYVGAGRNRLADKAADLVIEIEDKLKALGDRSAS